MDAKEIIARRIAQELKDGDIVNLGIGLPTMVSNYLPDNVHITLQSENGFVGLAPLNGEIDPDLTNAGAKPVGMIPGAAMFDSATSFMLIRGGHVDATVLGGLQCDGHGNLANWMVPGKMVPGMGGAMDLVSGAKKVIVGMEHCSKDGESKIVPICDLPLTGKGVVNMIVTELGVMRVTIEGLVLDETAPGVTVEDVIAKTKAKVIVSPTVTTMKGL